MSQFEFSLAMPEHDAELRSLLASTPMKGQLSLAFAREPSYFSATAVDGKSVQVGIVTDRTTGRIVGMGSRAIGARFVNERPAPVGYLSGLRLLPEYRGRAALLARGYRFLRDLHRDGQTAYYLTTIATDNAIALGTLTSGRAGLPIYHPIGRYVTLSINTSSRARGAARDHAIATRRATRDDRDLILEFLNTHGPQRQFFPAYGPQDLFNDGGWLQGLQPEDMLLAFRGDQLIGTLAAWDQNSFKQTIVHGYGGWLSIGRPLYNMVAALRRRPTLPAVGSAIRARYGAIPVVAGDDASVFDRLLNVLRLEIAQRGERLLLVGLHESDPLLPVVRAYAGKEYVTRLYLVHWPGDDLDLEHIKQRIPYLELGCL